MQFPAFGKQRKENGKGAENNRRVDAAAHGKPKDPHDQGCHGHAGRTHFNVRFICSIIHKNHSFLSLHISIIVACAGRKHKYIFLKGRKKSDIMEGKEAAMLFSMYVAAL